MQKRTLVLSRRVIIVAAALLCLFMSSALFISGTGASAFFESFNYQTELLFDGMLGILASVFSLASETLASRSGHYLLSIIGSSFVMFQGLQISRFAAATSGWHVVFGFGVPISILSMLGLVIVFFWHSNDKSF
jgi:hypothetical protein